MSELNNKDRIGICACYDTLNYGSMLQSFATQAAIDRFGYDSEYIIYKKKKTPTFLLKQAPRLLNGNLMFDKMLKIRKKQALKKHPEIMKKDEIRKQAFKRFQDRYYKKFSPVYYGYDELCKNASDYASVVVGSDQLWTPGGLASNFYNLMFVPDGVNKVSYATSFGVSSIPWYQFKRTREYLQRIDHISVREVRGAEIVKEISGREAKVVADPTLLLTNEEWLEAIPKKRLAEEPYIFCYFLGENPEHRDIADEFKKETGLSIVSTPFLDSFVERDLSFGDHQLFDIGPDDFVNLIRGAEYILTDSFHGSVFSIINHKKFLTFNRFRSGTNSRNSRIDSLCSILGLDGRRYDGNASKVREQIDFTEVDKKLSKLRNDSLNYLQESLKSK